MPTVVRGPSSYERENIEVSPARDPLALFRWQRTRKTSESAKKSAKESCRSMWRMRHEQHDALMDRANACILERSILISIRVSVGTKASKAIARRGEKRIATALAIRSPDRRNNGNKLFTRRTNQRGGRKEKKRKEKDGWRSARTFGTCS